MKNENWNMKIHFPYFIDDEMKNEKSNTGVYFPFFSVYVDDEKWKMDRCLYSTFRFSFRMNYGILGSRLLYQEHYRFR